MTTSATNDPLAAVRKAGTCAPNFELQNAAIIDELTKWQSQCSFVVKSAEADRIEVEFTTLPAEMDAFAQELYAFCPDLVDQGTGCVHEMIEMAEEMGEDLDPEMLQLIEGVDFSDESYGVEILKREIEQRKSVTLWWD